MPNSTRNVVILCFENEFEKMLLFISHWTPVALGVTIKYLRDEIKYFLGYVLFDKEAKWWTIRWELNFYTNSFCETSLKKKLYQDVCHFNWSWKPWRAFVTAIVGYIKREIHTWLVRWKRCRLIKRKSCSSRGKWQVVSSKNWKELWY